MISEGTYIISIWLVQAVIYFILTFDITDVKFKKRNIFYIAFILCLAGPWLFPFDGGYNPETGEYSCGLAGLLPMSIFWLVGNVGNLLLLLTFSGIKWIRSRKSIS